MWMLILILFVIALASSIRIIPNEEKTKSVSNERRLNPKYANSVKCKYCGHFNPRTNRCHLYNSFDRLLDKGNDAPYYKDTHPESRCEKFNLPAMEVMVHSSRNGSEPPKRQDGSYIVMLDEAYEQK